MDSREWKGEWRAQWVVYADLVGFGARAKRSKDVVLNNIVRFDRASSIAGTAFPGVGFFRFSDSTFGVAGTFHEALAFGIAVHHACLALNSEFLRRAGKRLFIHMIVPRVTLARGQVLRLPDPLPPVLRFHGLDPKAVLAGDAVVRAFELEKQSAAGLLTFERSHRQELREFSFRGDTTSVRRTMERWLDRLNAEPEPRGGVLFTRGNLLDFPWMLMRPIQSACTELWCATESEVETTLRDHFEVWDLSAREFYSWQGSGSFLETAKHSAAAIRHGVQCAQIRLGQASMLYRTPSDVVAAFKT